MRARRSGRGFTLLEVMVALALLAGALMAIGDLVGNALRNHAYARDLTAATLLARGKMAELEQKYEDEGFKDFDQQEEGDFSDAGRADVRWRLDLVRPDPNLSADQLVSMIAGATGADPKELLGKLMGGALGGALGSSGSSGGSSSSPSGPTTTMAGNPAAGMLTNMLQSQLTAFGELVKRSFREMRLEVSWPDGRQRRSFSVTTHLLVLNPRAPGGARGDDPEVPASLAAAAAAQNAVQGAVQPGLAPGGAPGASGGLNAGGGVRR